jgi:hypothetical protein
MIMASDDRVFHIFQNGQEATDLHAERYCSGISDHSVRSWEEALLYVTRVAHWSVIRQIRRFEPRYSEMRRGFEGIIPRPEEGILPLKILEIDGDVIR